METEGSMRAISAQTLAKIFQSRIRDIKEAEEGNK